MHKFNEVMMMCSYIYTRYNRLKRVRKVYFTMPDDDDAQNELCHSPFQLEWEKKNDFESVNGFLGPLSCFFFSSFFLFACYR